MLKSHSNTKLRTQECWERYQSAPKHPDNRCFLCHENGEIVQRYKHWFIIKNSFPYDAIAKAHHMLVPREHVSSETLLSKAAFAELPLIIKQLESENTYDAIMTGFKKSQTHPTHLHYHLLTWHRA